MMGAEDEKLEGNEQTPEHPPAEGSADEPETPAADDDVKDSHGQPGIKFEYQSECHCSKTMAAESGYTRLFEYQSECHYSKTMLITCSRAMMFEYQSECHYSKTKILTEYNPHGFEYQSECHYSKTRTQANLEVLSFEYQSECHYSKTAHVEGDAIKSIVYFDSQRMRRKQIDLTHPHRPSFSGEHTHHGYLHNEGDAAKGASRLNTKERAMVERVKRIWDNHRSR